MTKTLAQRRELYQPYVPPEGSHYKGLRETLHWLLHPVNFCRGWLVYLGSNTP